MAEGLARALAPAGIHVASAGSSPTSVNPLAVRVMREIGIDISQHFSKALAQVDVSLVGTAVTLCAEESCAVPRTVRRLHWPIADPAAVVGSEEDRLQAFRLARDILRAELQSYFA